MDKNGNGFSRREFLRAIGGTALGGIILSACGEKTPPAGSTSVGAALPGSGPPAGLGGRPAALPNGYRFFKIFTPKGPVLGPVSALTPGVMLNDRAEVVFYAPNKAGGYGLYELELDMDPSKPAIRRSREIIATGTVLADRRRVDNIVRADVNAQGSIAAVLGTEGDGRPETARQALSGVYVERERRGFTSVARYGQGIPGVDAKFGGHFGDIALNDNGQLLMVAHYMGKMQPQPGLFHLRDGANAPFQLVIEAEAAVPASKGIIQSFGLIDFDEDGGYVSQAFGDEPQRALQSLDRGDTDATHESFAVVGNVTAPRQSFNLAAASTRLVAPARKSGAVYMGPRVGARGVTALITHPDDATMVLWLGDVKVEETGQPSPGGGKVTAISAPVLGKDLLMYYLLYTEQALELCVSNGTERRVILRTGDRIDGQAIANIVHGYHSDQVDKDGRIVFYAELEKGGQAIVLGIPV